VTERSELIGRIWERDPTVWTGADEAKWLGWLDEPRRMGERVAELDAFADAVADENLDAVVLLGMGGSSLAPEVIKRTFRQETFHVLDTTHPQAIRARWQKRDRGILIACQPGTVFGREPDPVGTVIIFGTSQWWTERIKRSFFICARAALGACPNKRFTSVSLLLSTALIILLSTGWRPKSRRLSQDSLVNALGKKCAHSVAWIYSSTPYCADQPRSR